MPFWTNIRTAAQTHVCAECQEVIRPGQKYADGRGVCSGEFWQWRSCMECHDTREDRVVEEIVERLRAEPGFPDG